MQQVETFNRHMMTLARDSRGVTQSKLAKLMSVGQGTVSKYESGLSVPPKAFIDELSHSLNYVPDFFIQPGQPYGMPPFHYRKRKKLSQKALAKIIAEMNIRRIHLSRLLKSYDWKVSNRIIEIDRDEYMGGSKKPFSIEEAARQLREHWLLPDGPIENTVGLIEDMGGIIIPCNFNSDLIDAVSQRIDGMPVLFFVNMNAPADRIRLTLCHELAHMVLHTTTLLEDEEMEIEADRFAGSFLLPSTAFRSQFGEFNIRQIANLKRHWKVSMGALVMRADNLKMITPYQKKSFFIEMGKLGYRKNEPNEPPKEYPRRIAQILSYFRKELNYTKSDIANLLFIHPDEFDTMYNSDMFGGTRPKLHVVK
ncbi:MAG: XRE family transcriptional regulator [Hyphomicrobiaceae bacterium]